MKLNKHGWGLREMIILSGILIIFLFIAIYYIFRMYDSFNQEVSIKEYYDMEEKLEEQAKIYVRDYYEAELSSEKIIIHRSILRNYGLDVNLIDNKGDACSGYVIASKTKGIIYTDAYIKCNDYMTNGYEE